jgi:hypothetical protein
MRIGWPYEDFLHRFLGDNGEALELNVQDLIQI